MTVEIVEGLPAHTYHARTALSSTRLRKAAKGRAHYEAQDNRKPTAPMMLGTATSALLTGTWDEEIAQRPEGLIEDSAAALKAECSARDLAVSGTKAALADRLREAGALLACDWQPPEGLLVLPPALEERAYHLASVAQSNPYALAVINDSRGEVSGFWQQDGIGPCKARADLLHPRAGIWDLKVTGDSSWFDCGEGLARLIRNRGWHQQIAWYERAFGRSTAPGLILIYDGEPAVCEAVELSREWIDLGHEANDRLAQKIRRWHSNPDAWAGPSEDANGRARLIQSKPSAWMWRAEDEANA